MEQLQRRVLKVIEKAGTIHLRKLFKVIGVRFDEIIEITKALEDKGYIKSFTHGGYKFFSITEEGKKALSEVKTTESAQKVIGGENS
ncbi:MAG: hypothetical protein DRO00_03555 [Thermoproteota archaeon]|nr:MAG: hypothetical protein DRN92_07885 [Candidatus Korarchaeota archaeon]RLG53613.1 MAG: hypothetical protein DRO00_03555 [Candidatus Korarchaeota archaeon]